MKDLLLTKILGKAPWSVWKGIGSFLLFEFGPRRAGQNGRPQGTYTFWIYMAHWRIRKNGKEIAHSESRDGTIQRAAQQLQGKPFRALVLERVMTKDSVRHAARLCFDNGYTLQAFMYDDHEPDAIFMLYSPTEVLSFDYDGRMITKKLRERRTRRVERAGGSRHAQRRKSTSAAAASRRSP
jgi:hypothetical protein